MTILGVSCYYHDSTAALIRDGVVVASASEERFTRINHDESFPSHAIDFCLNSCGITARDLDYVVFYEKPFRKFHRITASIMANYPKSLGVFREFTKVWLGHKLWIKQELSSYLSIPGDRVLFSDHHLSHAASCFYPSPYRSAAILTVDGVGEWTTASLGIGDGNRIKLLKELHYPHSVGLLYSTFTAFLGFHVNADEGKVMGLAPYGKPAYVDKVKKLFRQHRDGSIELDLSYFAFPYSPTQSYNDKFVRLFGQPVKPANAHIVTAFNADIAASIQLVTEDIVLTMAKHLRSLTRKDAICLAGGVFLNSVINWRIFRESGFKNVFIQPGAGDAGAAIGAALNVYHNVLGNTERHPMTHAYLGQEYDDHRVEQFLKASGIKGTKLSENRLIDRAVHALTKQKIVGWFQGKFEHGPRALGNRSILTDPRPWWMKDVVNAKVKYREGFRPFAPSVIEEHFQLAIDVPGNPSDHHPLRYMLYVTPIRSAWQQKVAAINHVDNTARPQLVQRETNPRYHRLITAFYEATGVPMVLNTSFNLRGEPIVNSPANAYGTFMRSGMDFLALGSWWIGK